MELTDKINKYPYELSGGQQQRIAIARAIINNPKIILADEPTGALDMKTEELIMEIFKNLNSIGTTIIIVTHNYEIAKLCKRIYCINNGSIAETTLI